jgi:hypothetical protein
MKSSEAIVELVSNKRLSLSPSSGVDVISFIVQTIFTELSSFPVQTTWGTMSGVTVPVQTTGGTVGQSSDSCCLSLVLPYNVF